LDGAISCDPSVLPGSSISVSPGSPSLAAVTLGPLAPGTYPVQLRFFDYDAATQSTTLRCQFDAWQLSVGAVPGPTTRVEVVEFYNRTLDHYFMTSFSGEIRDLDTGVHPGWTRTGQSFFAYAAGASDQRGLWVARFYGRPEARLDTHFYSWYGGDLFALNEENASGAWLLETENAFEIPVPTWAGACPPDSVPVYRLWNQRIDSNHRYTTDPEIKQRMLALGYVAEGFGDDAVFMCAIK
jgi:hypothetical protein